MWSKREFDRRLDNWITGVNDPNAPFNQPDDYEHPMCQECPEEKFEECKFPCKELEADIEQNNRVRRKMEKEWEDWLRENDEIE